MKFIGLLLLVSILMVTRVGGASAQARFTPNGDGTLTDHTTCLMWEMKTGTPDDSGCPEESNHGDRCGHRCASDKKCDDARDVNNRYQWSQGGTGRDGEVFTDFLGTLNNATWNGTMTTGCFANHCDWRLPNIEELRAIKGAGGNPTIDPIFGPTMRNLYWSATSTSDRLAFGESFSSSGLGGNRPKAVYDSARAVRGPILGCSLP